MLGGQAGFRTGKWTAAGDDSSKPGYMLPLLLLSHCFGTFLATSAESAFYEQQRPLELAELYKPDDTGLLGLLKFALWQARLPAAAVAVSARSLDFSRRLSLLPVFKR